MKKTLIAFSLIWGTTLMASPVPACQSGLLSSYLGTSCAENGATLFGFVEMGIDPTKVQVTPFSAPGVEGLTFSFIGGAGGNFSIGYNLTAAADNPFTDAHFSNTGFPAGGPSMIYSYLTADGTFASSYDATWNPSFGSTSYLFLDAQNQGMPDIFAQSVTLDATQPPQPPPASTPEPASFALMGLGMVGIGALRHAKRPVSK